MGSTCARWAAARGEGAALSLVGLLILLGGCGDDPAGPGTGPREGPLDVLLTVQPASITPGQSSLVRTTAQLPDSQTLSMFEIALSGFGLDTVLDLPITGPGSHTYFIEMSVPTGPIAGQLRFAARARVSAVSDSAKATLLIADDGVPRLALAAASIVEPPDTLTITFDAEDAAGITTLSVRVAGAVQRDTTIRSNYSARIQGGFGIPIPASARLGDSVTIEATAHDGFGKVSRTLRTVRIADSTHPSLVVRVDTIHHAGVDESFFPMVFFPGDLVRIHVKASDNRSLTWLGYRMLGTGDSILVSGASDSAQFEYVIPPGTNTEYAFVEAFTSDSSGNRTQERVWAVAMDGTFRPVEALSPYEEPLGNYDQQGGYVLDAKRDVLYFAGFSQEIEVVGLSPLRALPPIVLGREVRSVDLTPSGDTLVAAVVGRPNSLLLWDLTAGLSSPKAIPVTLLGDCDVWDMQVAANGYALVTGWSATGCPTVEVDLQSGAQRMRAIPFALRNLAASGDHRIIVAWNQAEALVYDAATDAMTPVRSLYPAPTTSELAHAGPAIDHTGSSILIRNRLYSEDLTTSRWIQPDPGYLPPAPAIAADGRTAFLGSWPGYVRVDPATATLQERIILPRVAWRMLAHPDGQRLVVWGWRWVGVVDLR